MVNQEAFVEWLQGEGGGRPTPPRRLERLREPGLQERAQLGCRSELRNGIGQPSGCASFPKRNLFKDLQDPKGLVEGIPLVAGRMRKDLFGSVEHSSTCFRDSLRQARIVRLKNGPLIKL